MNTVLAVLGIVVALAVIAGAWWAVRNRRIPTRSRAPKALPDGWQFYTRPTQLEPPGTVFRIDRSKSRYIVDTLEVVTHSGEEAVGRTAESVTANMGVVARFFGLGPRLDVGATHSESLIFELKGASRQYVEDADLDSVLDPWLADLDLREGSRYYVIREALSGSDITYRLSHEQVDMLGGEGAITKVAKLDGNLHTSKSKSEFVLEQKFDRPLRVMFLPEELRPLTRGLAEETVIGRRAVTQPLVWHEADEPATTPELD